MKKDGRQARRRFGCRPEKSGGAGQGKRRQNRFTALKMPPMKQKKCPLQNLAEGT